MILDKLVTESIPFDIASYRVIMFESNPSGLADLKTSLRSCVTGIQDSKKAKQADNPVHDWLNLAAHVGKINSKMESEGTPKSDQEE